MLQISVSLTLGIHKKKILHERSELSLYPLFDYGGGEAWSESVKQINEKFDWVRVIWVLSIYFVEVQLKDVLLLKHGFDCMIS